MSVERPPLPKRSAATIRAAQERVSSARLSIIVGEKRLAQDRARVAEYEANPTAFARRHYGRHDVDSYPVQTNISRCGQSIEYGASRRQPRADRLREAVGAVKATE